MKTLHLSIIIGGIISLVASGVYIITNPIIQQYSGSQDCQIPNMNAIPVDFVVKLPTNLPTGYILQGVVTNGREQVLLFYADHGLCVSKNHAFNSSDAQLRIVITKVGVPESSTTYQNNWLKYASDPKTHLTQVQPIEINGYKGIGTESYIKGQSVLFFLNDNDRTQYSLFGLDNQSLEQLFEIAKSIPS